MSKQSSKETMAMRADRHVLYQESVQCAEAEIDFVDDTFRRIRARRAQRLREDFCGTANVLCEWVRRRRSNVGLGVDLDPEVLQWGREHNVSKLDRGAAKRLHLIEGDVMGVETPPVDIVLAMNFSYWIFKERALMRRYFQRVHRALSADGVFFLDCYGGYDAFTETKDKHKYDGFTYIWDQADYDPVSGDYTCHIHFRFPDGSRLRKAFSYHWRLWTLPELRELLEEAGFRSSTVYWEGTEEDSGEGNGEFEPAERGEADAAWIAYLVARK